MKKIAGVIVCLAVAVGILLFFKRPSTPASSTLSLQSAAVPPAVASNITPVANVSSTISNSPVLPSPSAPAANLAARAGQVLPESNPITDLPPEMVLQNLHRAIHQFGQMFGGNPVGTNPEITAALTGHNPKGINFLRDQPGMTVNAKGELIDQWGTPYFFHQISGTDMELHSAGPDRILWTTDDLVIK